MLLVSRFPVRLSVVSLGNDHDLGKGPLKLFRLRFKDCRDVIYDRLLTSSRCPDPEVYCSFGVPALKASFRPGMW